MPLGTMEFAVLAVVLRRAGRRCGWCRAGWDLDPALELRRSAARLVAACEADPANAALAKELRETLTRVPPAGAGVAAGGSLEQLSSAALGWTPGADPVLRDLAAQMLVDHGLAFLRELSDQVP